MPALVLAFFWLRDKRRWDGYVERLKSEPGIVVAETGQRDGKYFMSGLRDPMARDPQLVMQDYKVDPQDVISHWEPFHALAPQFVLARTSNLLKPPESVRLTLKDGVLAAEGFASHDWVMETRRAARLLPGLSGFNEDKLLDLNRIEDPLLKFVLDRAELVPGQAETFNLLMADIERLQSLAVALQKNVRLEISGHTDGSGTEARNTTLSHERAVTVAAALEKRLPKWPNLSIKAVGSKEKIREEITDSDRASNRSVTFKVVSTDAQ